MTETTRTRWWWVRHAPVAWAGVRIYGRADLDCDVSNAAAFSSLAARLPQEAVSVQSNLSRTRRTAAAIAAAGLELAPPLIEPDLAEQSFGRWEGSSWDELQDAADPHLSAFWTSPFTVAPPDGESFIQVVERVRTVVERITAAHPGRDIIAVAHAGSIRAALLVALDLSPLSAHAMSLDPLSLTRIERTEDGWTVRGVNLPPLDEPRPSCDAAS